MAIQFMKQLIILFLLLSGILIHAQVNSSWNVLLLEKGNKLELKPDMAALSKTGFYLYKNCVYEIILKNKKQIGGRLVGIKPDTLFFTNFFNSNAANWANAKLDTLAVYYKDLDKLNLISDRATGWYIKCSFDNYDFIFKKDTVNYFFPSNWEVIYDNDPTPYELVAHMTAQGVSTLFEESGRTYYFYGTGMTKPDRSQMDDSYNKKNVFWFTPCKVEEINGLALGLHAKNIKNELFNERDSLIIRGLNLEINPFAIFSLLNPRLNGPYPDSLNLYNENFKKDWQVKIYGMNLSLVNTINEMRIKGFNLTGLLTVVDEIHGVSISGINNFSYILNGVSIAGLRNRATFARGVQIGLFNKSTELRGFQIGLWNVNGRRSLPFINWQFKTRPKKQ
ncbi:MAG: hypothetical protein IT236_14295 [Bacteroidia bacterium]|nr:hypothetical protein [Bacteroidia bacterium]